jgi:hypothetical protein
MGQLDRDLYSGSIRLTPEYQQFASRKRELEIENRGLSFHKLERNTKWLLSHPLLLKAWDSVFGDQTEQLVAGYTRGDVQKYIVRANMGQVNLRDLRKTLREAVMMEMARHPEGKIVRRVYNATRRYYDGDSKLEFLEDEVVEAQGVRKSLPINYNAHFVSFDGIQGLTAQELLLMNSDFEHNFSVGVTQFSHTHLAVPMSEDSPLYTELRGMGAIPEEGLKYLDNYPEAPILSQRGIYVPAPLWAHAVLGGMGIPKMGARK